ncbi:MAG: hypothetical protein U1E02_16590, partial [Hydrogenophaga sp.]|nr:hypothetical protein [Hydrogenophaga sp.]
MNTLHRDFHPALGRANVAKRRRHRAARRIALLVALLLGGSMTAQAQTSPSTPPASEATSPVVNSALNAPLFYQLLLGELNVQAGEPGTGYSLILDAARKQRDALLYRRAVDVALQARSGEAALTAARAWAQDLPQSPEAHRFVLQILLALNRTGEASPVLRAILDRSSPAERNDTLNAIPQTFARVPDKAQALAVVREALAGVLKQRDHAAAAWTTLGRMELALDQLPASLASARQGHQSDPTSPFPALLALELLERGQPEAEALVRRHLLVSPQTPSGIPPVGLTYARILLDLQRYADARSQLDSITASQPALAEPWLLLATLQVQDNALPAATAS